MRRASTVLQSKLSMKGSADNPVYAGCTGSAGLRTSRVTHNGKACGEVAHAPLKRITQQLRPTSWPAPSISMLSLSSPTGESCISPAILDASPRGASESGGTCPATRMAQAHDAAAPRAVVAAHPLDDDGSAQPLSPPHLHAVSTERSVGPGSAPPRALAAWFRRQTGNVNVEDLARLPVQTEALQRWLDTRDSETRAVIVCLARALWDCVEEHMHDVEETLREAMLDDDAFRDTTSAEGRSDLDTVNSKSTEMSPEPQVLAWMAALAREPHVEAPQPASAAEEETLLPADSGEEHENLTWEAQNSARAPVELVRVTPWWDRPPPSAPPDMLQAPLISRTDASMDHFGFLRGISVTKYWQIAQWPSRDMEPSLGPTREVPVVPGLLGVEPAASEIAPCVPLSEERPMTSQSRGVYEEQEQERKVHWDAFLAETARHTDPEEELSSAWDKAFLLLQATEAKSYRALARRFQRLCEYGIPMTYRPIVWSERARVAHHEEPGVYQTLLSGPAIDHHIELDVRRTMPTNIYFGGIGPGVPKLRRVLSACARHVPSGYCQGMNNLAAVLLLTYTHEEDAFWALIGLLHTILPHGAYDVDMRGAQADQAVLVQLVRAGLPKLAAHMDKLGAELPPVTLSWFLSLFTVCLPTDTVYRAWDLLFLDGSVVMFRIAYAILSMGMDTLLATKTAASFYDQLRRVSSHMLDADALVQACAHLRDKIRASDIMARRAQHLRRVP